MERSAWFERKFNFDYTENIFPEILRRLEATPRRLTELTKMISDELLTSRPDGKWSIKENIGHLSDLEPLWQKRLNDIKSGAAELSPADLNNTKTNEANHNSRPLQELLNEFSILRRQTLSMLDKIDEDVLFRSSLHPRLKKPMRTMDLFLFVAEHDDHHLETISLLTRRFLTGV
jgi:uncharacterized damage-inducible protein DinB